MDCLAVINQVLSFKTAHTALCLVTHLEDATFSKSLSLSVMNYSPVAQMVTFVFEVVTVPMRGEWNSAARDYGEELHMTIDGIDMPLWLLVGNLVFLSSVSLNNNIIIIILL